MRREDALKLASSINPDIIYNKNMTREEFNKIKNNPNIINTKNMTAITNFIRKI